jgi:hypothetical protein
MDMKSGKYSSGFTPGYRELNCVAPITPFESISEVSYSLQFHDESVKHRNVYGL